MTKSERLAYGFLPREVLSRPSTNLESAPVPMNDSSGQTTHPSLLKEIAEGNSCSRSWPVFVDKYGPILHRWCRRWGASPSDADDVVQECLIVVFRKLDTYRNNPRSNFRSWLKTVAFRIWLQVIEVSERKLRDSAESDAMRLVEWDRFRTHEARNDLAANFDAVADQEILEMACSRVRSMVEPDTWRCFELLKVEGVSGQEVADRLNIKVGSVFTNACRVRKLLKQEVDRLESE